MLTRGKIGDKNNLETYMKDIDPGSRGQLCGALWL